MRTRLELEIPQDVIKHAKESGISIEEFRKSLEIFGTMQLASETSRLDKRRAGLISERIKASSWKKLSKSLNL
jgi:DNA-binding transcriptional MerR regulator